jgi:hypothetical protein
VRNLWLIFEAQTFGRNTGIENSGLQILGNRYVQDMALHWRIISTELVLFKDTSSIDLVIYH